ncbi:MAG: type II toxin-antitoxin system RelE/ParE family toxin [Candidatus Sulfotelmatobacter sp.]
MSYSIRISPSADREIRKLDRPIQKRILRKLEDLEHEPRPNGVEKLSGGNEVRYRVRVGDYCIVYRIDDDVLTVLVLKVGNRKNLSQPVGDSSRLPTVTDSSGTRQTVQLEEPVHQRE